MLTIELINDQTGTDQSANYRYRVLVNGQVIDQGQVCGHNRADNWRKLVALLSPCLCHCSASGLWHDQGCPMRRLKE